MAVPEEVDVVGFGALMMRISGERGEYALPMPRKKRTRRLTVYLFESTVTEVEQALLSEKTKNATRVSLSQETGFEGCFVYQNFDAKAPDWIDFVGPLLDQSVEPIRNQNSAGALILKFEERVFGFTFGFGRSFLDLSKVEPRFGLRVALNMVDPKQLKSLSSRTFDSVMLSTDMQSSKVTAVNTFEPDEYRDIVRAISGDVNGGGPVARVSGTESLVFTTAIEPAQLDKLCERFLMEFRSDEYTKHFPWVDKLTIVSEKVKITALDGLLVKELNCGVQDTHLAAPEIIDWTSVSHFEIEGAGRYHFDDLDLDEYCENLRAKKVFKIETLKRRKVSICYSRTGEVEPKWKLYDCLVSEQRMEGILYALISGRWFEINESLVKEVDAYISTIPEVETVFRSGPKSELEEDFNQRVTDESEGYFLNLDRITIRPTGASSPIEMCDLLGKGKEMVHVKRKSRSATLSHLFAQGSVSLEAFLGDGDYRENMKERIIERYGCEATEHLDLIPDKGEKFSMSGYKVWYVIVADSSKTGTDWLPFFSKLNLKMHAERIRRTQATVQIKRVSTVDPIVVAS